MKIGILTFTDGTNIGQRLQNYALQTVLEEMGHEVYTIKQEWPFSKIKRFMKSSIYGVRNPRKKMQERKRRKKFDEFNSTYIHFYDRELSFAGDNSWISNEFDVFVAGSDQIWNPMSPFVGDNFFLGFARPEQRYTYAPSFSVDSIPDNMKPIYIQRLNRFETITVREEKGAQLVKELTGQQAHVVLDPTLFLNRSDWDCIKTEYRAKKQDYVLTLLLGLNQDGLMLDVLDKVKSIIGTNDIAVMNINNLTEISPTEFLDAIERAKFVVTDSYHVSIFAAIYRVPFINISRAGTSVDMNSRFSTLYSNLGIESRNWNILRNDDNLFDMDFITIEKNLVEKKLQSRKYLEIIK